MLVSISPIAARARPSIPTHKSASRLPTNALATPRAALPAIHAHPASANVRWVGPCDETCVCSEIAGCATNTFRANGTVSSCSAALACCATFAADANSCVGLTQADCISMTNSPNCTWDTTSSTCTYNYTTCCASGAEVQCFADPETGVSTVYCAPQPCTCPTCANGLDCDPTTPDATNPGSCICFKNTG